MKNKWLVRFLTVIVCFVSFVTIVGAQTRYTSGVKGSDYTNSSKLASKLDSIFAGNASIYSDSKCNNLVNTALGQKTVPNNNVTQYVGPKGGPAPVSGTSCWIYGNGVYYTLFNEAVGNGTAGSNSEKLSGVKGNKITYENFQNWGVRKGVGAYIRVGTHSIVLLGYDSNYLTYLSGNDDGHGLVCVVKESWDNVSKNSNIKGNIDHIIQPKQSYFDSLYPTCSHDSYYTSEGRCKKCGSWAPYTATSVTVGTYKVSSGKTAYLRVHPYIVSDETIGELVATLSAGTQVTVSGGVKNYFGNVWYEVTYGSKKGYIVSTSLTFVSAPDSTLKISPSQTTYTINKGSSCELRGSITSNYTITSVVATIDGHSPYEYANFNPNSKTVDMGDYSSGKLNSFKGATLSVGTHVLTITANCGNIEARIPKESNGAAQDVLA